MKTLILILFLLGGLCNEAIAQNEEPLSSNGDRVIQPDAGYFGIGFDAVPFLEYVGNIFNGSQNNSLGATFPGNSQQIFAKYFIADETAIRVRMRVGQDRIVNRNRLILDNQPDPDVEVTDQWINHSTDIRIGGGMEFRKGNERIAGVFGGELSFLYNQDITQFEYGNSFSESNQAPSSTFGNINNGRFERIAEERNNKQLGAGINGFIGVEYFIAPKLSLGAEFTLGLDFIRNYRAQDSYEFWDATTGSVQTRSTVFEGDNSLSLDTGNYGGSINLMFYF